MDVDQEQTDGLDGEKDAHNHKDIINFEYEAPADEICEQNNCPYDEAIYVYLVLFLNFLEIFPLLAR